MIKAVLFDMDDTLLDINLTAFMSAYVADTSRILASISGAPTLSFGMAYARGYLAVSNDARADGLTNQGVVGRRTEMHVCLIQALMRARLRHSCIFVRVRTPTSDISARLTHSSCT